MLKSQNIKKIEKSYINFIKKLGQYLIKFNDIEAISNSLAGSITHY